MPTTSYTQVDYDAIQAAIVTGEKRVRLNNREVEYQSISQMIQAAEYIASQLDAANEANGVTSRRPRAYRGRTNKGL